MSWSTTTLSTTASLAKIEREINSLIESSGTNYLFNGESIATSSVKSDSLDVSGGMIELIAIAATAITIKDGQTLSFTVADSADDSTFVGIYDGLTLYSKTASGSDENISANTELFRWVVPTNISEYVKVTMNSHAENSGTVSLYSYSKWSDKITLAKSKIKNILETWLMDFGYKDYIDWDDSEELIDLIANPSTFELSSDLLTLHYIYRDLATGKSEDHIYYQKSIEYKNDYAEEIAEAIRRINLDVDQDDDTDEYRKDWTIKLEV